MDRRGRGMPTKRRIGIGSVMKNKRSEDEEKICQYFLQGKCLKVQSIIKMFLLFLIIEIISGK